MNPGISPHDWKPAVEWVHSISLGRSPGSDRISHFRRPKAMVAQNWVGSFAVSQGGDKVVIAQDHKD